MHVVEQTTELHSSKWQRRHQSWVIVRQKTCIEAMEVCHSGYNYMVNNILARMFTRNSCMSWPYYTVVFFSGNICVYILQVSVGVLLISTEDHHSMVKTIITIKKTKQQQQQQW